MHAKSAYVTAMRAAGRLFDRTGAGPAVAPNREQRLSHWAHSLTKVHDSAALVEMDVPWWTYGAINTVERWLLARQRPIRVFEYGSGASTVWLARRVDEVHSVEHHKEYAAFIDPVLAEYPNIEFHLVEAERSDTPNVTSQKEGYAGLDFSHYVDTVNVVGGTFDLIVIDGRAREACLDAALAHLSTKGLIVFDNSARRRYRPAIEASALTETRFRGLVPTLPYPDQTSLLQRPT